jgi:hypothetical protein
MKTSILSLGDWHEGLQQTLPVAYDPEILNTRARSIPGMLPKKGPDSLFVTLLGDMVEGCDIFPQQNSQIRISAREQVERCTPVVQYVLNKIESRWKNTIVLVKKVPGNHGRTSKTAPADNNWDLQLYSQLKQRDNPLHTHPTLTFYTDGCTVTIQHRAEIDSSTAKEQRCVKPGLYLATPAMKRKIERRLDFYQSDLLIGAHWHQGESFAYDGKIRYVINGALCGPTTHSEALGCFAQPKQAYIELDPVLGPQVSWLEW